MHTTADRVHLLSTLRRYLPDHGTHIDYSPVQETISHADPPERLTIFRARHIRNATGRETIRFSNAHDLGTKLSYLYVPITSMSALFYDGTGAEAAQLLDVAAKKLVPRGTLLIAGYDLRGASFGRFIQAMISPPEKELLARLGPQRAHRLLTSSGKDDAKRLADQTPGIYCVHEGTAADIYVLAYRKFDEDLAGGVIPS